MNIFERIKEDVEHFFGALTKEDKKVVHDLTDEVAKLRADVDRLLGKPTVSDASVQTELPLGAQPEPPVLEPAAPPEPPPGPPPISPTSQT